MGVDRLPRYSRARPSSTIRTATLCPLQKSAIWSGHQRVRDVQDQGRDLAVDFEAVEAAPTNTLVMPPLHDDAEVGALAPAGKSFRAMLDDEALGGGPGRTSTLIFLVGRRSTADAEMRS